MFDKIKAALVGLGLALIAAAASYFADLDWGQYGAFGAPVGAAVAVVFAYIKKETAGYGAGVPKPSDAIPGGQPLPTGAADDQ